MQPQDFIVQQPGERQPLLTQIHETILANDPSVTAVVELMMGKEMIVYHGKCNMKYALSSVTKYMSLHLMPMYASPEVHARYKALLPDAKFQKGCLNFVNASEVPIQVVAQLIQDCAPFDLAKMKEDHLRAKKK
jgi:hypothetical protein